MNNKYALHSLIQGTFLWGIILLCGCLPPEEQRMSRTTAQSNTFYLIPAKEDLMISCISDKNLLGKVILKVSIYNKSRNHTYENVRMNVEYYDQKKDRLKEIQEVYHWTICPGETRTFEYRLKRKASQIYCSIADAFEGECKE